jgi:hypothetical protein
VTGHLICRMLKLPATPLKIDNRDGHLVCNSRSLSISASAAKKHLLVMLSLSAVTETATCSNWEALFEKGKWFTQG